MLKQLEIQGFKSFSSKTILEFPSGITAVVGPNGAGKSNIVDAIRWVLGEQSLKSLRSEKSEDVIFSGTPKRAATSLASVALYFENQTGIFSSPYPEIVIGRKLYRDGTSEYFLNRTPAKLKEVTQLLASAKFGLQGLGIINQGSADLFLQVSGAERREMLEEMLGLKEFRLKKEEAEKKLEETGKNIEEAKRLLGELEPNLRGLKRQALRWERRQEKEESLRALEESFFLRKIQEIQVDESLMKERGKVEKEIQALRKILEEKERELTHLEKKLPRDSDKTKSLRDKLNTLESQRHELSRAIGKIEGQLETLASLEKRRDLTESVLHSKLVATREQLRTLLRLEDHTLLREELQKLLRRLEEFLDDPREENDFGKKLLETKEKFLAELKKKEIEVAETSEALRRLAHDQELSSESLRSLLDGLEKQRRELREKEKVLHEYELEMEKHRLKKEDLETRMREAGLDYEEFLAKKKDRDLAFLSESFEDLEAKIFRLKRELADIGLVDEEIVRQYEETSRRVEFIQNQKSDLEKALKDLQGLSRELEEKIYSDFEEGLRNISHAFHHYFNLIFGGGSAKIFAEKKPKLFALPNEEIPAKVLPEIEITVSLPRKKIKGIEMLSGGERALTAIALLFAIVGTSEPPFLVLDEVDAALDETNSQRFAKLLRELSRKTQFVVVTHNRATMEAAKVLYGVTMEDGVSRIFSLQLEEAEAVAAQDIHQPVG
ncbi:MAG: AAA family ATPase [Parcubacteria group bacterium]|nr:AAA family ATPase [Parcubacteria group bacterium]